MKLQVLLTTVLLLTVGSVVSEKAAIATPLSPSPDAAKQTSNATVSDQNDSQQKQTAQRDRQRQQELQRRERQREREAARQERQRDDRSDDDTPWWDDERDQDDDDAPWWDDSRDQDDNAPWWDNRGQNARQRDRERQRDAQQRERDRRELEEWQEDQRDDRDDDRDDDDRFDDWNDDRFDDWDDDRHDWNDIRRSWERQQNLLEWQWNNWRSSISSPETAYTRVELTSLSDHQVTVSIEGIDQEIDLSFNGDQTRQTVDLVPGAYRIHFRSSLGDRAWQSGYLNVGRTGLLRIVFDQNRSLVQVYDDPYAWTSENFLPF